MWLLRYANEFLGIGAAFTYAAATYGVFHFLDRSASGPAKRAFSQWISGERYQIPDFQAAVIGAFDHFYGSPLLSAKTLIRSALYTSFAFVTAHPGGPQIW
jgi:hypothetical protein